MQLPFYFKMAMSDCCSFNKKAVAANYFKIWKSLYLKSNFLLKLIYLILGNVIANKGIPYGNCQLSVIDEKFCYWSD